MVHPFEATSRICSGCGGFYCDGCLVSPWGPRKPSLCVQCAIERSGVRSKAGARKVMSARDIRSLERQQKKAAQRDRRNPVVLDASPILEKAPFGNDEPEPPKRGRKLLRRG